MVFASDLFCSLFCLAFQSIGQLIPAPHARLPCGKLFHQWCRAVSTMCRGVFSTCEQAGERRPSGFRDPAHHFARSPPHMAASCSNFPAWQASCRRLTTCTAGQRVSASPTATSDRECAPCPNDTFQDQENSNECHPHTICQPGTVAFGTPPSAVNDRGCNACKHGKYSDGLNQAACASWTDECGEGFYESRSPSATADRTCSACPSGCGAGQFVHTACGGVTPLKCGNCFSACKSCAGPGFNDCLSCPVEHAIVDGTCISTQCTAGEFFDLNVCTPCNSACAECNGATDVNCTACEEGLVLSGNSCVEVRHAALSPPYPRCSREPMLVTGTASVLGRSGLAPLRSSCLPQYVPLLRMTKIDNAHSKLQSCPRGTFVSGRTCVQCTECAGGEFDAGGCVSEQDRTCIPWKNCGGGFSASVPDASVDRVCTPCEVGKSFQPGQNQPTCIPVSHCARGFEQVVAPTASSDRLCALCDPAAVFYDPQSRSCAPNARCHGAIVNGNDEGFNTCEPCPAGRLPGPPASGQAAGTTACRACPWGTFVPQNASGACSSYNCPAGTTDHDRDPGTPCQSCPAGTYASVGSSGVCTECAKGFIDHDGTARTPCEIGLVLPMRSPVTNQMLGPPGAGQASTPGMGTGGAVRDVVFQDAGQAMAVDNLWRVNQTSLHYRLEAPQGRRMLLVPPPQCGDAYVTFYGSWCRSDCDPVAPRTATEVPAELAQLQLLASDGEEALSAWNLTVFADECCVSVSLQDKVPREAMIFETAIMAVRFPVGTVRAYYVRLRLFFVLGGRGRPPSPSLLHAVVASDALWALAPQPGPFRAGR